MHLRDKLNTCTEHKVPLHTPPLRMAECSHNAYREDTLSYTAISPTCALMNANHIITSREVKQSILQATEGVVGGQRVKENTRKNIK